MGNQINDAVMALLPTMGIEERKAALESLRRIIDEEACGIAKAEAGDRPVACPRCGSVSFVRRGRDGLGKQRYSCRDCGRSFNGSARKIMATTKLPGSTWMRYAECFVDRKPLRDCAAECHVSLKTSFFMRHRILEALAKRQPAFRADAQCGAQLDETSFRESFKGNHTRSSFKMPRPARKRGGKVAAAERIGVMTGINDAGDIFYSFTSRGINAGRRAVRDSLAGMIEKGAVIATDDAHSYLGLFGDMGVSEHIVCPSKGHGLNRVNSMHARMKEFFRPFKGVATKHLESYLAWFKWAWSYGWSRRQRDMAGLAMRQIHDSTYDTTWRRYRDKPLVFFGYWEDLRISRLG